MCIIASQNITMTLFADINIINIIQFNRTEQVEINFVTICMENFLFIETRLLLYNK